MGVFGMNRISMQKKQQEINRNSLKRCYILIKKINENKQIINNCLFVVQVSNVYYDIFYASAVSVSFSSQ